MSSKFLYGNLNERQFDMLDLLVCCGAMTSDMIKDRVVPGMNQEPWDRWLSRQHAGEHVANPKSRLSIGAIIEEHERLCGHPHRTGLGRKVAKGSKIPRDEQSYQPVRWRVSENGMYQYNLALEQLDMMAQMGVTKEQMMERQKEWFAAHRRASNADLYRQRKLRLAHSA